MKKYILIIAITALCIGKINSQVIVPDNLTLSGTQTGNNDYEASDTIKSTQVINSGKTTYTAGESVILNPGFKVELGAEFEIVMKDDDSFNNLTMMTYNLWGKESFIQDQSRHAEVISIVKPDVVSVQEVWGKGNFNNLKTLTGMDGKMCYTLDKCVNGVCYKTGIGILWNTAFGTPKTHSVWPMWVNGTYYEHAAYMIAEFDDFCFIATHYPVNTSTAAEDRVVMTNKILNNSVVKNCINLGKPIYIGGDFNFDHNSEAIQIFIRDNGFEVLNNTDEYRFTYPTLVKPNNPKGLADMIIEYNTNPTHKLIESQIPEFLCPAHRDDPLLPCENEELQKASDHFPYFVKVKLK